MSSGQADKHRPCEPNPSTPLVPMEFRLATSATGFRRQPGQSLSQSATTPKNLNA